MATIIFTSKVTGGITDVYASVNGKPVAPKLSDSAYAVGYKGDLTAGTVLKVVYAIVAMNGTDYSIDYTCMEAGVKKSDPSKPSPVSGTIAAGNTITETLNIQL
jgi:hypothetical protein